MDLAAALVAVEEHADLLRGKPGVRGPRGDRGERGPIGPAGEAITGPPGKDGQDGRDGVGAVGPRGPIGPAGKDGKDGKSIKGETGSPGKDGVGPDEKVRVSADDPRAGFLADKLTAGNGIEIRTAGGKRGERLVIDARPQLSSGGGGASGILVYDDGVGVGAGDRISFDGGDPVTISAGIIRVPVGSGGGGAPSGPAGGDLSGTYPNPSVTDDSHVHTAATLPVVGDFIPQGGPLTADLDTAEFALRASGDGNRLALSGADGITGSGGYVAATGGAAADGNSGAELAVFGGVDGSGGGGATVTGGDAIAGLPGGNATLRGGQGDDGNDAQAHFRAYGGDGAGNAGRVEIQTNNATGSLGEYLAPQGDGTAIWAPLPGLPGSPETYTESNVATDRAFDANVSTLDEVLHVLGTLIGDLRARGLVA